MLIDSLSWRASKFISLFLSQALIVSMLISYFELRQELFMSRYAIIHHDPQPAFYYI